MKNLNQYYNPTFNWPLAPRNPQQLMALELLLDPNIQFVLLIWASWNW